MKTIIISTICFFFSSFIFSQNIGDKKTQKEAFGSQPTWNQLTSEDTVRVLFLSDYFSCKTNDKVICWNAIDNSEAEVQEFLPSDKVFILTKKGKDFIYKYGCHNRMRYIRTNSEPTITQAPAPSPQFVVVEPTVVHYPKDIYVYQSPWGQPNICRSNCGPRPSCGTVTNYNYQSPWGQPRTTNCSGNSYGSRRSGAPARRNR